MPKNEPTADDELEGYIPRPEKSDGQRKMVAIDPDTYDRITTLATKHDTTRGRIIRAVTLYFLNED